MTSHPVIEMAGFAPAPSSAPAIGSEFPPSFPNPDEIDFINKKEVPPVFHTVQDYQAALRFFILRYPKVQQILNDWSKDKLIALRKKLWKGRLRPDGVVRASGVGHTAENRWHYY
jgi:hypothetical protein